MFAAWTGRAVPREPSRTDRLAGCLAGWYDHPQSVPSLQHLLRPGVIRRAPGEIAMVIIDYGMGNLRSVQKAIEAVGLHAEITSDPEVVRRASRVILPGVGAFADAAAELR